MVGLAGLAWRWGLGCVAGASGALTLLCALGGPALADGVLALDPPASGASFARLLAVAAGAGLLVLAHGLVRGKRRAADAATAVLCAVALVRIARDLGDGGTLAVLALAAAVFATRPSFGCGGESRPGIVAPSVAVASVAGVYVAAAASMLAGRRVPSIGAAAAADLAGRAAGHSLTGTAPLALALDALAALGLVAAARFLHGLLRPAPAADGHSAQEHLRAAALVAEHGGDSLDPFLLREDKAFHFAAGGVLAYRTLRETAVVSGDPVGPPGSAPAILADFRRHALANGWDVVVTAASARHLDAYGELGMRALHIGNEAVVDPRGFSLDGRRIRKVRQSVNRVKRRGWSISVVEDQRLTPAEMEQLEAIEREWRSAQPRVHGFAMTLGHLWAPDDAIAGIYVLGRDPGGAVRAFLRFVRCGPGLSLDVVRRPGDEPNGLSEALVVAALEHARAAVMAEVSLNFAGFAHLMAADAALTPAQRLLRRTLCRFHGRFQLERLVRFNEKFGPTWRGRYLVYERRMRLPLVALRVLQAEAYIRPPRSRPLSARWVPPGPPSPSVVVAGRPARTP